MGEANFEPRTEKPMNNNVPQSPAGGGSQVPSSTSQPVTTNGIGGLGGGVGGAGGVGHVSGPGGIGLGYGIGSSGTLPLLRGGGPSSLHSSSGSGVVSGHHTLAGPPDSHYFRPIVHHQGVYTGRPHDDFDLTSDSDGISSPTSSIIGPPPPVPPGARPPSPHHLTPLLPPSCYPNGNPQAASSNAGNPPGKHLPLSSLLLIHDKFSYHLLLLCIFLIKYVYT